jgi:hypothetical protein
MLFIIMVHLSKNESLRMQKQSHRGRRGGKFKTKAKSGAPQPKLIHTFLTLSRIKLPLVVEFVEQNARAIMSKAGHQGNLLPRAASKGDSHRHKCDE